MYAVEFKITEQTNPKKNPKNKLFFLETKGMFNFIDFC